MTWPYQAAGRILLKEIAARQGISEKYLENILATLVRANMLSGMRQGGGYVLTRPPEQYTVGRSWHDRGQSGAGRLPDGDCGLLAI
ncbi:MAG: RrF2 family transcriptional regulator [Collinsella sp.]